LNTDVVNRVVFLCFTPLLFLLLGGRLVYSALDSLLFFCMFMFIMGCSMFLCFYRGDIV
jgi:hypothetical protein